MRYFLLFTFVIMPQTLIAQTLHVKFVKQRCGVVNCGLIEESGSGVCISKLSANRYRILTVAHGARDANCFVAILEGVVQWKECKTINISKVSDLALLDVETSAEIKTYDLGTTYTLNDPVVLTGFPRGQSYRARHTVILSEEIARGRNESGESGGAVLKDGKLIGIQWGFSGNETHFTGLRKINDFLAQSGVSINKPQPAPAAPAAGAEQQPVRPVEPAREQQPLAAAPAAEVIQQPVRVIEPAREQQPLAAAPAADNRLHDKLDKIASVIDLSIKVMTITGISIGSGGLALPVAWWFTRSLFRRRKSPEDKRVQKTAPENLQPFVENSLVMQNKAYVPISVDYTAEALDWALREAPRSYPGCEGACQHIQSLVNQHLSSNKNKGVNHASRINQ